MNSLLLLVIALVALGCGYRFYGTWLSQKWGVDNNKETPAHTMEDGIDYVPAKAPVLMGHHFSSIAGAGPITGPISAAAFGWLPCSLWIITVENPSVRSFPQICPREQRVSSSFSRI